MTTAKTVSALEVLKSQGFEPVVSATRDEQPELGRKPYDGKHSVADGDMPEPNIQLCIYCAENSDSVGGGAAALGTDGKWYWTHDWKLNQECKYPVTHWIYL